MDNNINQIYLENLSKRIGIGVVHGWKKALSLRLNQKKQTIIATWIKRGVPKEFDRILRQAGLNPSLWKEITENVHIIPDNDTSKVDTKTVTTPDHHALEIQISLLRDHVNTLSAMLTGSIAERKTDIDRIDKFVQEIDHRLGVLRDALIQAEKQKDFLPLRILTGRK